MPEAPEVQVVLDTLQSQIQDAQIIRAEVYYDPLIEHPGVKEFSKEICYEHFRTFERLGKYLLFGLDTKRLICHLRMEGKFYLYEDAVPPSKHIYAIFYLKDGRKLCYHDTRKFGRMSLYPIEADIRSLPPLQHIGLDFSDPRVEGEWFYRLIHSKKRPLKAALLDQELIAGIGNIYANEICFACGLDPRSRCNRISKKDCVNIVQHMRRILFGAIRSGGSTIRDYTSSLGVTGRFQLKLKVHEKEGLSCPVCGHTIEKIVVAQRGTYLCRHCQKRK